MEGIAQETTTGYNVEIDRSNPAPTDIYITSMTQGTFWKKGWKNCKFQYTRKSIVKYSFLEMAA